MQRAVSALYKTALWCLDSKVKPPLVWHWDALEMAAVVKDDTVLHEVEQGYSAADVTALWDPETEAVHAVMRLCLRPMATIIMFLLHELAHANGVENEKRADEWALEQYRRLARSKRWTDKTGIRLGLKRGAHRLAPDDRVWAKPVRLPLYQPSWVLQRY